MKPIEGKWAGYGIAFVGVLMLLMGAQGWGESGGMAILGALGLMIAFGGVILSAVYWRCPSCRSFLPTRTLFVEHCHRCGESIDEPMFRK